MLGWSPLYWVSEGEKAAARPERQLLTSSGKGGQRVSNTDVKDYFYCAGIKKSRIGENRSEDAVELDVVVFAYCTISHSADLKRKRK